MSDEWFYEGGRRKRRQQNWVPLLFVIMVIVNAATIYYFVNQANDSMEELNVELEMSQFQLSSVKSELADLKSFIASIPLNNISRPPQVNASIGLELAQIYERTKKSVVLISVTTAFGGGQGSGFVYDYEGRIITNNHVVEDAKEITVTFIGGTVTDATLIGTDPYVDLAVIDVEVPFSILEPIDLGSSSELLVGEQVIALGNPFGLANTMTSGIVSATGRQMDAPGGYTVVDVIQTDAAINPGNSGGPLLNLRGQVVGMNTAILSETNQFSGIGFAIPSDTISREVPDLIENGVYEHPYLGIRGMALIPEISEIMGLDKNTKGAYISEVTRNGPADNAGLRGGNREENINGVIILIGGDIIIGVDGIEVKDFNDLVVNLERNYKPGEVVTLTFIRDKEIMDAELELGIRPGP
jgi:S1-C subfamily serine protease